jgi:hypothetical protein
MQIPVLPLFSANLIRFDRAKQGQIKGWDR